MAGRAKTERVLWNYRQNQSKAEEMREMYMLLASVRGQDYGAHTVNGVSDPVSEVVHRKLEIEKKLMSLSRQIKLVEDVQSSLDVRELRDGQMLGILRLRYMEHKEPDMVMREMGITKPTYYRRNNELIELAGKYVL